MQVLISFDNFKGIGEIPATDLEAFLRVIKKLSGVEDRYIGGEHGHVLAMKDNTPPNVEVTMLTTKRVVSSVVADRLQHEVDEANAALEHKNAAELATLVAAAFTEGAEAEAEFKALVDALYRQHGLHYKENENAILKSVSTTAGVRIHTEDNSGNKRTIVINPFGAVTKTYGWD